MNRFQLFLSLIIAALFILTGCLSIPLFSGFGSWETLPSKVAPSTQSVNDERFSSAGKSALAALEAHRNNHGIPGLTAAVAFQDKVVWSGASGWANVDENVPIHEGSVLRIGSTSKAITATALARLIENGKMTLDDPIAKYADTWPNETWNKLTPRQLASHTAGFPGYDNNGDRFGKLITLRGTRHYTSVHESLEIFDDGPLLYPPGTDFAYSSFDVNLLGAAIAASNKKSFLESLQELVFDPLKLVDTGGDQDGIHRPNLTKFYEVKGNKYRLWKPFDLSQRWPGGGLVSTSRELAKIGISWLNPEFIHPKTKERMWTPQKLNNGETNEQQYAIGWRFYTNNPWPNNPERTIRMAHHGGISKGAMSWLVVYPDYQLSIALNANGRLGSFTDFNQVESKIASLFLSLIEQSSWD